MSEQLPLHISGKAVVVDPRTNRALILRLNAHDRELQGRDEWHLPGGVRDDPAEKLPDTARREVREETGIEDIAYIGLVDYGEWQGHYEGDPSRFLALVFEFELAGDMPDVQLSHESSEFAWVGQGDLDAYPALMPEALHAIGLVLGRRALADG